MLPEFKHILVTTGEDEEHQLLSDTELISLNGSCTISLGDYPKEQGIAAVTGLMINDRVIVCGGYPYTNECYNLNKGDTDFKIFSSMQVMRAGASSINIQEKMWITGGYYGKDGLARSPDLELCPKNQFFDLDRVRDIE